MFQWDGAAEPDGLPQNLAYRAPESAQLVSVQFPRRQSRRDAGAKQGFAGINVTDPGDDGLIEQLHFDGLR
jgi:hypothetical protein